MRTRDFRGGLFPVSGKPRPLEPKENFISKQIEAWLERRGIYTDRQNSGMVEVVKRFKRPGGEWQERRDWLRLCKKGTPDRMFILSGKIGYVEVKMRGMAPTEEQLAQHDLLRLKGAWVIVADSLESFVRQFRALIGDRS